MEIQNLNKSRVGVIITVITQKNNRTIITKKTIKQNGWELE
ncbi:hypothetical protein Bint_2424 [Brachyspira intermedia PWS/A]|uniref:Uncharacterized protein n=1 Tax=Brachyspira intermedia (strain ATCC 51140 / PWS/A) TaxID=1045858 RepID=G0EMY7_BRAIP|nr:hypothetical protein Bint_2424 [Brachyspira intermedia PWS/A]